VSLAISTASSSSSKGNYRENGAKDFFLRNAHLRFDASEDSGFYEPPGPTFGTLGRSPAEPAFCAFFFRDAYVIEHFFVLRSGRHRADLRAGIERGFPCERF